MNEYPEGDVNMEASEMNNRMEAEIPAYVLPGYELVRQEFGHVDRDVAGFDAVSEGRRTDLKGHPAVVAMRDEIIGRLVDLAREDMLWRVYFIYTLPYLGLPGDGEVSRVTVIGEVYKAPGEEV